jgi:hypothetical protein
MADIEYSDAGFGGYEPQDTAPERARGARLGAVVNWAGALMSLGLIVGMGIWAVQLLMRDVSGVPVIAAIEGPMRQPPADPGGTQAPHQGLAVNRIAEGEEAQPVPDRLVLAPPPIELQEVRFETAAPAEVTPVPRQEIAAESPGDVPQDASETDTAALIDRLLQEAQTGVVPEAEISVPEDTPVIDLAIASEAVEGVLPASVPGIARSLRPGAARRLRAARAYRIVVILWPHGRRDRRNRPAGWHAPCATGRLRHRRDRAGGVERHRGSLPRVFRRSPPRDRGRGVRWADLLPPSRRGLRRSCGLAPVLRGSGGTGYGLYTGHCPLTRARFGDHPGA